MPKITNRLLTTPQQGLSEIEQRNARLNAGIDDYIVSARATESELELTTRKNEKVVFSPALPHPGSEDRYKVLATDGDAVYGWQEGVLEICKANGDKLEPVHGTVTLPEIEQSDWAATSGPSAILNKPGIEPAAEDGSTESLVSTGEKYVWNSKEDASNKVTDFDTPRTDAQYPSAALVQAEIARIEGIIRNLGGFEVVVSVTGNPPHPDVQNPSTKIIYLYKDPEGPAADPYTEWIYTESNAWETIGTTAIDLTPYYTKIQVNDLLDGKVDTVSGKGLSTNDYTTEEKTKLSGIETGAQVNVLDCVSIDGTALAPSNKVVNVPKASGTSGSYVTGVVGGDDVERWNSWTSADKQIPYEYVTIDDRAYRVVTIGNKKWMAENLDYLPEGIELLTTYSSGTTIDNSGKSAYYHSFDEANAKSKKLGLLYNLNAFKDIVSNQASLFPEGWRIPVKADFDSIFTALNLPYYDNGGVLMKNVSWANSNWNAIATDTVGFAAIPSGYVYNNAFGWYTMSFACAGNYTWNTGVPGDRSGMSLQYGVYHNTNTTFDSSMALSIRLVKDA